MSENLLATPRKADASCVGPDVDAFLLQDVLDSGRNILILMLSQVRRSLDNGDFTPKPPVHLREFQADVAAAYDDQVTRKEVDVHDGAIGEEWNLFDTRHLGHHRAAAYVDEYPIRREPLRADAYLLGGLEAALTLVHGAVCHTSQPALDAGSRLPRNRVLPRLDELHIDTHRAIVDYSVLGRAANHVGRIRTCDHRLGGCAAGVDTRAAEQFALNDRNFHSRPCQALRQEGPSLTGSDDNRVEGLGHRESACTRGATWYAHWPRFIFVRKGRRQSAVGVRPMARASSGESGPPRFEKIDFGRTN